MILRCWEEDEVGAIRQGEYGELLPLEVLLDEDFCSRGPVDATFEHRANRLTRLTECGGDDDPFSRSKSRGLDDNGSTGNINRSNGFRWPNVPRCSSRRDAVLQHDLLGESLARFQLGGLLRRAEDKESASPEHVGDAGSQRRLRTDDHEIWAFSLSEPRYRINVGRCDLHAPTQFLQPGVPRGSDQVGRGVVLPEFPANCVFPAAAAEEEDLHVPEGPLNALLKASRARLMTSLNESTAPRACWL